MNSAVRQCLQTAVWLALTCGAVVVGSALATDSIIQAPNVVPISASLVTSGQPTREALSKLSTQGFGAVIYLAPPTVHDAVAGEAEIIRSQGLDFVNIPIPFGKPTEADCESFVTAMNKIRDRKVLVHCQVNMRASSMTFLYRVIVDHEAPDQAYQAVAKVWSPEGPWKKLLVTELRKAGIDFEPY
ncbi:protein tyrosine phosphatase family protein [Neosynechococcus sphagnicola]|uniref:protein tyrosine phosphatase family protein n=1 Tax=Neosynechococcus sphagnicola TaxID=1501145 RepID=UPI000689C187|nr:protein tyrosine phosphatase family protein [Neosynechococcus sphagnicola]